jgi:PEP-CTERM motif
LGTHGGGCHAGTSVTERFSGLNLKEVRTLKIRIASLTILCLALAAIPAWADYENGPINGTTDAWTINFGYVVSDTFLTANSDRMVTGFSIGVWEFPGDTMTGVDWSITDSENSPCPSDECLGNGTAKVTDKFLSTNQYGYNIDLITVSGLNVGVPGGVELWLNLQNATVPSGDPVYWDENSGAGCKSTGCPSSASESAVGTIPSEAFTIGTSGGTTGSTPEPSSIMLFGSGILGLAGLLRRKLF